jgi:molecular chaperone HscB
MLDFSQTYFELFGLPKAFAVDTSVLGERYRQLQRVVHPDRYANASDQERRLAVQSSSHINTAFQTLKEPLARARYMLLLHDIDVDGRQESTADMAFLMQQMEWRETLAEARATADPYAVVAEVMAHLRQQQRQLIDELGRQLDNPTAAHLAGAREVVRKMQFLQKLQAEAEQLEAQLDDELDG